MLHFARLQSTFELLVAETSDGRLDLGDSFIFDTAQDMYAKPEVEGKLPNGPIRFQVIPWTEETSGDMLKYKDPASKVSTCPCMPSRQPVCDGLGAVDLIQPLTLW